MKAFLEMKRGTKKAPEMVRWLFSKGMEGDYNQGAIKCQGNTPILLLGGAPLNKPIVRYGPFVMNNRQEIHQAIDDYRNGKLEAIGH